MKKLILFLFVVLISITSAQSNIEKVGVYRQGQDIQIVQTCSDCTYVTLEKIQLGDKVILNINENMTKDGTVYNWTLDSQYTTSLGEYLVFGFGDTTPSTFVFAFTVTPSGSLFDNALSIPLFLPMLLMLLIAFFFFFLTHYIKKDEYKFTFLILGGIFLIFTLAFGIIASREVLYGFPLLYGFVNSFYRIFIITLQVSAIVIPVIVMIFVIKRAFAKRGYMVPGTK